jgi:acetoacetate decarboxylase
LLDWPPLPGQAASALPHDKILASLSEPNFLLKMISGVHIQSDLTLGLGTVIHDYLAR